MGLLAKVGLVNLANPGMSGKAIADKLKTDATIEKSKLGLISQQLSLYTAHRLIAPAGAVDFSTCSVSYQGASLPFASKVDASAAFKLALAAVDVLLGGGDTALTARGDKQNCGQAGLEYISEKFYDDHCTANEMKAREIAKGRIYAAAPKALSTGVSTDDVKALSKEVAGFNSTGVFEMIEEVLRRTAGYDASKKQSGDLILLSENKLQIWTYKKPADNRKAQEGKLDLVETGKQYIAYALCPDNADASKMIVYHYECACKEKRAPAPKDASYSWMQITKEKVEKGKNKVPAVWPIILSKQNA